MPIEFVKEEGPSAPLPAVSTEVEELRAKNAENEKKIDFLIKQFEERAKGEPAKVRPVDPPNDFGFRFIERKHGLKPRFAWVHPDHPCVLDSQRADKPGVNFNLKRFWRAIEPGEVFDPKNTLIKAAKDLRTESEGLIRNEEAPRPENVKRVVMDGFGVAKEV